jgi:hypothetical protein
LVGANTDRDKPMTPFPLSSELIFIALTAIALLAIIAWAIYVIIKAPSTQNRHPKIIAILIWHVFLLALLIYTALPFLPLEWARTQSLQAANEFLKELKEGDSQSAQEWLSDDIGAEYYQEEIQPNLANPANQPASWALEVTGYLPPAYVVTGLVTLDGGKEIPVEIHTQWEWERAAWKIYGVRYNPYSSNPGADDGSFLSYTTDRDVLRDMIIMIFLPVISIFVSTRYLLVFMPKQDRDY